MFFKEYLALQEMAARKSTNRLVNMTNDKDRLIVVIAASREGKEIAPNATKTLEQAIKARGYQIGGNYGITPTWGVYKEPGQPAAKEKSLFISWPRNVPPPPNDEIIRFFTQLAEEFQQIGVIIKLPGEETAHEYLTSHAPNANQRVPYLNPRKEEEPMYSTRPRFRGYGKQDQASRSDALTYSPNFDNIQQNPYTS